MRVIFDLPDPLARYFLAWLEDQEAMSRASWLNYPQEARLVRTLLRQLRPQVRR